MKTTGQVNGLYPIIRRVRRPLLPVDLIPDGQQSGAKPAAASPDVVLQNESGASLPELAKESEGEEAQ